MIHRVMLKKNLHDAKWLLLGCSAVLFGFCWLRVWLVSRLDTGRFKALLELLPADWRRFLPVDPDWLITYTGRISLTYNEPIIMLCLSAWVIARASDAVSGEIGRGTMEILLAQPIRRSELLLANVLVTLFGIGVISSATWLGIEAGVRTVHVKEEVTPSITLPIDLPFLGNSIRQPFAKKETVLIPMRKKVDSTLFAPAVFNLFSAGFMLAGLTTLVSACDRYRWRTIGMIVGFYVLQMIVKVTAMSSAGLDWLRYFTVLTAYEPEWMVRVRDLQPEFAWSFAIPATSGDGEEWGPSAFNSILWAIGLTGYVASFVVFTRRDLPAPT